MLDPTRFADLTDRDLSIVPLARAETIPSAWYVEPRFHELDREAVFARSWQMVAHAGQLREPGDHVIGMVAGNPIIVVLGKDRALRAFYNVCRHRGGPLAVKDGRTDMLQCKYHGWTYQLDGMLRGVPHFNRTELFDKKDYGLIPVEQAEWEGLIFVNLEKSERGTLGKSELGTRNAELPDAELPTLEAVFAGIRERVAWPLSSLKFARRVEYEVRCNWKVYVDNFQEGYHVPHVHPDLWKLYDFEKYHTETCDWYTLQVGPLTEEKTLYSEGGGEALYYQVFPNFMLNVLPGRLQTNLVEPLAADRCRVTFHYFYDDVESPAARKKIEEDLAYSDHVQREDIEICERVQLGLSSRVYDRGRFSVEFEAGVHHFQGLIKNAYREYLNHVPPLP